MALRLRPPTCLRPPFSSSGPCQLLLSASLEDIASISASFFHGRPVSMATDRLKDELQSGSWEAERLE